MSTETGGGSRKGTPPLCYNYEGEAQATDQAGISNIWAHLNNSCSFAVDCVIHNDATDAEQRVAIDGYKQLRVLLAAKVPAKRVRLTLECNWNP